MNQNRGSEETQEIQDSSQSNHDSSRSSRSTWARWKKPLIITLVAVAALNGADSIVAMNTERRFSNELRETANLPTAPYAGFGGAAYTASLLTGTVTSISVRAGDIEVPGFGLVSVESGASDVELDRHGVLTGEFHDAPAKKFFTKLQLDGIALGRLMGFTDLVVQNIDDISPIGGWETEALLEATLPGDSAPTQVAVELRVRQGVVHITPYEVVSLPDPDASDLDSTLDSATEDYVPANPEDLDEATRNRIFDAFTLNLSGEELPLSMSPTRVFVSGGSIFIEAEKIHAVINPEDFLPVAATSEEFEAK